MLSSGGHDNTDGYSPILPLELAPPRLLPGGRGDSDSFSSRLM